MNYNQFLNEILDKPAKAAQCYKLFHNYSLGNQWLASHQMQELEPINTYKGWQGLGRQVKKGAKAIELMMPVSLKDKEDETKIKTFYIKKKNWFKLSDTSGADYQQELPANFDLEKALAALEIKVEKFAMVNGNCQGYAKPNKNLIAINPLASDFFKTSIHEMAHCLLHKEEENETLNHAENLLPHSIKELEAEGTAYIVKTSLGIFEGLEFSRNYIKGWLAGDEIKESNFKRILSAATKILKAGAQE
jgi:antirestriction protein ArdC